MPEIFVQYALYLSKICLKNFRDMPDISLRFALDASEIFLGYA